MAATSFVFQTRSVSPINFVLLELKPLRSYISSASNTDGMHRAIVSDGAPIHSAIFHTITHSHSLPNSPVCREQSTIVFQFRLISGGPVGVCSGFGGERSSAACSGSTLYAWSVSGCGGSYGDTGVAGCVSDFVSDMVCM
jgi:hypothetical protein